MAQEGRPEVRGETEVREAHEIPEKCSKIRKYSLSKGSQCVTAPSHRR